jgi:phage terminase large subunit-like protein
MNLFEYQKDIVTSLWKNRKTAAVICRQAGKTTVVAAFVCWYIIFNDHKTTAILANKAATAREILAKVQFAYELLPKWIQQGVVEWNKGSFVLENG